MIALLASEHHGVSTLWFYLYDYAQRCGCMPQVWYFPANVGHAILGLSPIGCTYLAGVQAMALDSVWKVVMVFGRYQQSLKHEPLALETTSQTC
jgi:hypothetical protein